MIQVPPIQHDNCTICKLHISECVCENSPLNDMSFYYLENNEWIPVKRSDALVARQEGLQSFFNLFKQYIEEDQYAGFYRWAIKALEVAPLYFWVIPSSSSGKYHPPFSQGYKGLVRHVLAVVYMTREIARTYDLNDFNLVQATIAAALHDICKYGLEYNPRYFGVHECLVRVKLGKKGANILNDLQPHLAMEGILSAVESHNGNIVTGEWTAFRRPPEGAVAQVVHLADYVVSRKQFHFMNEEV